MPDLGTVMGPGSSDRRLSPGSRWGVRWYAFALVLLLAGPLSAGTIGASHAGASATPVSGDGPLTELDAAARSLGAGAGPAHGVPAVCGVSLSGGSTCAVAPGSALPALTVGPVWTDVAGIQPQWPTNRSLGALVWDGVDGYVLLFGGCSAPSTCNGVEQGDTWAFSDNHWENLTPTLSVAPSGRAIPQIAYDVADNEVVLFGGLIGNAAFASGSLNDTWTFAHGVWTNITTLLTRAPLPRYRGAMTYDAADGYVLLFGGTYSSATQVPYKDTWKFVNNTWTNITTTVTGSPPGRYRAAVAYDAADKDVVLFGGCLSAINCPTSNTWTYAGGAWTNRSSTLTKAPAARVYPTMAYDARDGYVLLFGGSHTTTTGPIFGDTWKFVNNNWTNLTTGLKPSPPQAGQGMLAFDGADNLTLYFGGYNALGTVTNGYGATWAYGPPIEGYVSASPGHLDVGQSEVVNVSAASDATPLGYVYANLPAGCTGANVSRLTCIASAPYSSNVSIAVNDTRRDVQNYSVPIVIVADPAIVAFRETYTNITVGSTVNFTVNASGGTLPYRYAYHALPGGCASLNADNLSCVPRSSGNVTVVAQVIDAVGFSVTAALNLTVHPPPSVRSFNASILTTDVGLPIVFSTNASGGTPPLHYAYSGLPTGCVGQNVAVLTCRATAPGQTTVQVNVTDLFGWYATATVAVTVYADVRVDSAALSLASIDAGTSFTLWVNASGGTTPLSYTYSGLPAGCALNGSSTGTCRAAQAGNYTIVANITDAVGGSTTTTLLLTVVPDPTIAAFNATRTATDVGFPTTFATTVANGTPTYGFAYRGLPPGCASNDTSALTCTPTAPGRYTVTVTLTDAFAKVATAGATLVVNQDVRVTSFNASVYNVTLGQPTTLALLDTGGTGAVTIAFSGLPAGCSSQNTSSLACTPTVTGSFDVIVRVHDGIGSSATTNLTLTVTPVPHSSSGLLGGSGSSGTLLLVALGLAAVAVIAGIVLWSRRRRRPPEPEPEGEAATAPAPQPWDER